MEIASKNINITKFLLFLIFIIFFTFCFISDVNAAENSYWNVRNKPEFYGTTAIRVPVGTEIDIKHDVRFRIFAKDNESGDLTSKIVITENTINSDIAGEYYVSYEVTDEHNNTVKLTVPVTVEEDGTEIWLEKTMYSLPSVDHLNALGYYRGNYMDRQIIGLFLDVDESGNVGSFEMRKISGIGNLTIPLQNNNGYCESTVTVSGEYSKDSDDGWKTIINTGNSNQICDGTMAAVPTVKTLYKETKPVIYEIRYNVNDDLVKPLHYYHEGDGFNYETQFLREWKADINSFAILDGLSLMALMPYEDSALVYNKTDQRSFDNFDEMFKFWTRVYDNYDELIGISYTPDYYWNQAVKTKFFVRANKHGAGSAYYSYTDCVGKNSTSMYSAIHPWWGTLHEYGHGYQGNIGSTGYGMPITEVAVNIFSYYIQELSGIYPANDHWLGNIDDMEDEWNTKRKEGTDFIDSVIGSDTTLYALLNILNAFDDYKETYAYINQYYKEVYFTTNEKLNTQDAWVLALEKKYNVNLVPYFESWGIEVSEDVKEHMMLSDAEVVYYLNDMLSDSTLATELKEQFGNSGEYDLVSMSELKTANLTGTVKIKFNISDFNNIKDKYLIINNGDEEIAKIQVTNPEMTLTLPIGVYKVAPPRSNVALEYDRFYITVVNDAETNYEITYRDIDDFCYGNGITIQTRGYHGENYIAFKIDTNGHELSIRYRGTWVRDGGSSSLLFSKITVLDENNIEKYSRSVNGGYSTWTTQDYETETVDIDLGYKLKIYYRGDKNDMKVFSELTKEELPDYKITNTETNEITYIVTEYGLVPEEVANNEETLYELYKERIHNYLEKFSEENANQNLLNPFANSSNYNTIISLVSKLKDEDKKEYDDIIKQVTTGDFPTITLTQDYFVFELGDVKNLDYFKDFIEITDKEDGIIDINSSSVKITSDIDWNKVGVYTITIEVTDKQYNVTSSIIKVEIKEKQQEEQSKPNEDNNSTNNSTSGNTSEADKTTNNGRPNQNQSTENDKNKEEDIKEQESSNTNNEESKKENTNSSNKETITTEEGVIKEEKPNVKNGFKAYGFMLLGISALVAIVNLLRKRG